MSSESRVTDSKNETRYQFNNSNALTCWDCRQAIAFPEHYEPDTVYLLRCESPTGLALVPHSRRIRQLCKSCAEDLLPGRPVSEGDCDYCNRPIVYEITGSDYHRKLYAFCCAEHGLAFHNGRNNKRRQLETALLRKKVCEMCGESFTATRKDAKTCGPACKQK